MLRLRSDGGDRVPDAARRASRSSTRACVSLARAVADLELHSGRRTLDETAALYAIARTMRRGRAARGREEHDVPRHGRDVLAGHARAASPARARAEARRARRFASAAFHDRVLSYGAIPVMLIARLMAEEPRERRSGRACWWPSSLAAAAAARAPAGATPPRPNDLLVVGYDREPDTLNRFSTHILEDIQTCVVEGLTSPMRRWPSCRCWPRGADDRERRRRAASGRRHGRHVEAAARHEVARRHAASPRPT